MNRAATGYMILLTSVLLTSVLLTSAAAGAATPGSRSASKAGAGKQDLQGWLARLRGSFTVRHSDIGETKCSSLGPSAPGATQMCTTQQAATFVSSANCLGIGDGPGLRCTFEELRREPSGKDGSEVGKYAPASFLSNNLPVRALFGIDPAAGRLNVMFMDSNGAGYSGLGSMDGDDVTFKGSCEYAEARPPVRCTWTLWVHAPAGGKIRIARSSGKNSRSFDLTRVQAP